MIEITNSTEFYEYDKVFLQKILRDFTKQKLELVVTDSLTIQTINNTHRGINMPTDVLSFPHFGSKKKEPLGSIVINIEYVMQLSQKLGHTPSEEFTLLFIHGMLHLLGHDHEKDHGEMRELERKIITKHNLPESLIIRNTP